MTTVYGPSSTQATRAGLNTGASSAVRSSTITDVEFWSREQTDLFQKWASSFEQYASSGRSPYFDYFFTGQDIATKIEGLGDDDQLPIFSFGYVIEQQKQPVYGFWDYTYSAVLRGTRLVTGAFTLVTRTPNLLTMNIAKAATARARAAGSRNSAHSLNPVRGLTGDEANINEYWYKHYDNNLDSRQQHLFSVHPPFNFLMKYGIQETSLVTLNPNSRIEEIRAKFNDNSPLSTDTNERLVQNPSVEQDYQILIENIEIMNMTSQYDTEGNPILETYTFMARDVRLLSDAVYGAPNVLSVSRSPGSSPV